MLENPEDIFGFNITKRIMEIQLGIQNYIEIESWKRTPTDTLLKLREGINKELRRRRKDGN